MTLAELLAGLMGLEDRKATIKGLQEQAHPIYQAIFDAGHSTATAEAVKDKTRLEGELATAKADLDKAKGQAGKGDEAAWTKERDGYLIEIADLKEKVKAAEAEAKNVIRTERHGRAMSDLQAKLIALGLDKDYAELQCEKQATRDRVQINDDGTRKVLQAGKTIPYAPSEGKDPLDLMAQEIHAAADKKFVTANGDRGSGQENRSGGAGSGNYLADLKAELEKQREAESKTGTQTLDERLRRVAPVS